MVYKNNPRDIKGYSIKIIRKILKNNSMKTKLKINSYEKIIKQKLK